MDQVFLSMRRSLEPSRADSPLIQSMQCFVKTKIYEQLRIVYIVHVYVTEEAKEVIANIFCHGSGVVRGHQWVFGCNRNDAFSFSNKKGRVSRKVYSARVRGWVRGENFCDQLSKEFKKMKSWVVENVKKNLLNHRKITQIVLILCYIFISIGDTYSAVLQF